MSYALEFLSMIVVVATLSGCSPPDDRAASAGGYSSDDLAVREFAVHNVCPSSTVTLPGIDVSHWQDQINWDAVAGDSQVQWAYMRIGDGMSTDREFVRNWTESHRVGIPRGAYQYFRPGRDATEQAEHFLAMVGDGGGTLDEDLPPMIDVETTDGQSAASVRAKMHTWIDIITEATGKLPIIYTGSYFWDDNGLGSEFAAHHVWTAHYTSAACPLVPDAWDDWTIWQYSSSGSIAGISGNVDMNRFDGSLADLTLWPTCTDTRPLSECDTSPWWCPAVEELYAMGIFPAQCTSYSDAQTRNRGQWARLIGDALTLAQTAEFSRCASPYTDVAPADVPYVASLAALDRGDGAGVFSALGSSGLFYPTLEVTRCEAVSMIVEAWGLPRADGLALAYTDVAEVDSWCEPYLKAAANAGVVVHAETAFRPNDGATVGETATMLLNTISSYGRPQPQASDFNDPSCLGPCTDVCTPGAKRCVGANTASCETGADGCGTWSQAVPCGVDLVCVGAGLCEPECVGDECEPECVGDECEPQPCVSECSPGERTCDGGLVAVCVPEGQCGVWSLLEPCETGEICVAGSCSRCNDPALCDVPELAGDSKPKVAEGCGCDLSGASTSPAPLGLFLLMTLAIWRRVRT